MNHLILSLLLACGGAEAPHGHDHDGDHAHEHEHEHHEEVAQAGPIEAPLGGYTARLEPSEDALRLVVVDSSGKTVQAEGEARVLLTGTGEAPQKVVLSAEGDAWTGEARAAGAPGYLAVVRVTVGGHAESARLAWGEVPRQEAAPEPHDHGAGGHDHGAGGHEHGAGGHDH